jgi:Large polyvalent protein-associated domain 7/RepB DNA-primase C-terminal helical domain
MVERQRHERRRALAGNWRGKGAALNAMRSILAARHAQEKAALRERHQRERQQLSQRDRRWPGFEDWLRSRDSDLADRWRFRDRTPAAITGEGAGPARQRDIRDFQAAISAGGVQYRRQGQPSAAPAFTDKGKRIVIHNIDRESVLAALQLASQKWVALRVSGPDAYQKLCVELAAEHGFKLSNPELQPLVSAARSRRTGQQLLRQMAARPLTDIDLPHTRDFASSGEPVTGPSPVRDVMDAYRRHFDDLSQEGRPPLDVSRLDQLVALRLRITGHSRADVERAIREVAARRNPAEKRNWTEYARRAARHAFGVSGDRTLAGMAESRTFLIRLEGKRLATGPDTESKQTR